MPVLPRFDTPARMSEPTDADRDAWSKRIGEEVSRLAGDFPQFFDPTATDLGAAASPGASLGELSPASPQGGGEL